MCGIVGLISFSNHCSFNRQMINALAHRGPDAQGIFESSDGKVTLGHTRLSIIDLSTDANQPFFSADGRFVIVFNGEIYNYKNLRKELLSTGVSFRTNSDTEVIILAYAIWGAKMVEKLDGMFALAIYDIQKSQLFMCRDRTGKKPLYYYKSDECFVFASEIKALLHCKGIFDSVKISYQSVITFLHLGYIPEPFSIYDSISKFPSGHWAKVKNGNKIVFEPYYRIQKLVNLPAESIGKSTPIHLEFLLNKAVEKRLISDVPIGVFLSGGTDSSLIAALVSRLMKDPVKTFCVGFTESEFDESKYARLVAKHLGTEHHEFLLKEQDAVDQLEIYLKNFDEPFADTSSIPTMLLSKFTRQHVTVALTGDGGDELFLGYGAYNWANRLNNVLWKVSSPLVSKILKHSGVNRLERIGHMLDYKNEPCLRSHIFSQEQYFFSQSEIRDSLLKQEISYNSFLYAEDFIHKKISASEKQAIFDLSFYLKDDLLVKVDRASMYYGLECRSPFLDNEVINYALQTSKELKVRNGERKWILKEILKNYLPSELVYKKKWGFSIPLSKWLRNDLRFLIDRYLSDSAIEQVGIFNTSYVNTLKQGFLKDAQRKFLYNRIWLLIVIQKWILEYTEERK